MWRSVTGPYRLDLRSNLARLKEIGRQREGEELTAGKPPEKEGGAELRWPEVEKLVGTALRWFPRLGETTNGLVATRR